MFVWCSARRTANPVVLFSLRKLNEREAYRLSEPPGYGRETWQAAHDWAQQQQVSMLRVANSRWAIISLRFLNRYIASGANIDATAYWLYR